MWIALNDAYLSIVENETDPDQLHVRARRRGDIEAVFPDARVRHTPGNDYAYRADVPRERVAAAIADRLREIDYTNFKNSVDDTTRHAVYSRIWSASHDLEPRRYYDDEPLPQLTIYDDPMNDLDDDAFNAWLEGRAVASGRG